MDEGHILLVNLASSDYLSEENARVFGALLVNEFFECARRRKRKADGHDPSPYYLYMDEFQNFVSLDIANMLDQVRKRGLFQVLAHQRFGQLDENITEAVLVNAKIKAVFGGLTSKTARMMAEELFIGKIDPMKIKVAIEQTKFWPQYDRDKAYTSAKTRSTGSSSGASFGSGGGLSSSSADFFQGSNWFGGPGSSGASTGSAHSQFSFSGSGESTSESEGTTESVADIPIFRPVPFKELSSIQYYTPEEQLSELTASLKEQFQRHCFIKIQQQDTQPMLVPFVKSFYTTEANQKWYRTQQLNKHGALPAHEIDRLLVEQEDALLNAAGISGDRASSSDNSQNRRSDKKRPKSARKSIWNLKPNQ
jgi:hypothetical protein